MDGSSDELLVYGLAGTRRALTQLFLDGKYRGHSLSMLPIRAVLNDVSAVGGTVKELLPGRASLRGRPQRLRAGDRLAGEV